MILLHPSVALIDSFPSDRAPLQDLYKFEEDSLLKENLPDHLIVNCGRRKKSFECPICKKKFTRKENRKLHMKSHHCNSSNKELKKSDTKSSGKIEIPTKFTDFLNQANGCPKGLRRPGFKTHFF
ncbi:zinc finger protein 423 [Caerostris extrusa]|uniref:Zinc finger protein 423 n=1 Tax=Caerostris extrusa TaxID=172846 RepID=A0AAV4WYX1_CAEEX|nr:zinc finger protein 423 [Caerostris extrusa]